MASINEYLIKIQELTNTNLNILQTINDSFFTKKNHLTVNVGDSQYVIPSFIALENKLNFLQENLTNIIHAPESGEAYFNIDGNSRSIMVRPYNSTPNSLTLSNIDKFGVENKDIFKDFLYPNPYVKISLKDIPNDITTVIVKKVVPKNEELKSFFEGKLTQMITDKDGKTVSQAIPSSTYLYKDLYKILTSYKQDVDYVEYDTVYNLPVRKNLGSGVYVIKEVISDIIDENLDNIIKLSFRNDLTDPTYCNSLTYKLFDETIEKNLKIGDELVTFDGTAKVSIVDINRLNNELTVKVVNGEYLNFVPSHSTSQDNLTSLSKLKFHADVDFDSNKYVQIPLEEDQFVFVSVAVLNNTLNIQSSWGTGLMLNTYILTNDDNKLFREYYINNVNNIGDMLLELSSLVPNTITKFNKEEFEKIKSFKPTLDSSNLLVTQINKHLDNSPSIQNIRALYSQKKDYQNRLDAIQTQINSTNEELASVSFDDTSGIRGVYTNQLVALAKEKNDIYTSLNKILTDIATAANNSEVPIENAKYRIRGFYKNDSDYSNDIIGIRVQYRYKNVSQEQGTAMSIDDKFIFSDWINMNGSDRKYIPVLREDNINYKSILESQNDLSNEPSFNQIDIPITQGETVDIRMKLVYGFGYPFVETTSDWSDIINIKFPEEYLKDVQILDIISENNDDIETNRFNDIIKNEGIIDHVDDKIQDQDIVYYHKPDNISSGFYTEERRIIPLKDKLNELNNSIILLNDMIFGSPEDSLEVSISNGDLYTILKPYQMNNVMVEPYNSFNNDNNEDGSLLDGNYIKDGDWITTTLNISIKNTSKHTIKLFSLFPGPKDTLIHNINHTVVDDKIHYQQDNKGVWMNVISNSAESESDNTFELQRANQFITFRLNNPYNGEFYYVDETTSTNWKPSDPTLHLDVDNSHHKADDLNVCGAYMYPSINDSYSLSIDSNEVYGYLTLNPESEILIPIVFEYNLNNSNENINAISKTMCFELRPSLYKDCISYIFKVTAKTTATPRDKVILQNRIKYGLKNNQVQIYKTTVK